MKRTATTDKAANDAALNYAYREGLELHRSPESPAQRNGVADDNYLLVGPAAKQ